MKIFWGVPCVTGGSFTFPMMGLGGTANNLNINIIVIFITTPKKLFNYKTSLST